MALRRGFNQFSITVIAVFLTVFFLAYHLMGYDKSLILEGFKSAYGTRVYQFTKTSHIDKNQIIFPSNMKTDNLQEFVEKYRNIIDMDELKKPKLVKAKQEDVTLGQKKSKYNKHPFELYDGSKNIDLNLDKCSTLKQNREMEIDKPCSLDKSLVEILQNYLAEYKENPYYEEMAPFFIKELELQIKYKVVDRYWYRLAGSSVWLKNYGVHFMISRVMYSPKGHRNQPILSLTYAQIFDKNWKELTNTKLLVPSNLLGNVSDKKKRSLQILKFPYFLPIPFYHDYDDVDGKYYGPEDPRIILVKNENGYEEPLIVFNAYHRKLGNLDDDEDSKSVMRPTFFRSMFICWPWQTQKGKANVDGMGSSHYDNMIYNRLVELRIKNLPRQKKQKNWTPFISQSLRAEHKFDKYINFVYRWANLEILKCDLSGGTGICSFTYRLNNNLFPGAQIGPLRGGTSLININGIMKNVNGEDHTNLIPAGREIWVGFARAHLDKCGCGNNMYRPNLVVLVKDSISYKQGKSLFGGEDDAKEHTKDVYKISHLSSSISFDIPIIGWDLNNPKAVCYDKNILIPNGISSWSVDSLEIDTKNGKLKCEDYLTLSVSISDFTVDKINIKGLLNEILNLDDKSLILVPKDEPSDEESNEGFSYSSLERLNIPDSKTLKNLRNSGLGSLAGFNNDNVVCALQASVDFCSKYGEDQDQFESENEEYFDAFDFGEETSEIQNYNNALQVQNYRQSNSRWNSPKIPSDSINKPKTGSRPGPNRVNQLPPKIQPKPRPQYGASRPSNQKSPGISNSGIKNKPSGGSVNPKIGISDKTKGNSANGLAKTGNNVKVSSNDAKTPPKTPPKAPLRAPSKAPSKAPSRVSKGNNDRVKVKDKGTLEASSKTKIDEQLEKSKVNKNGSKNDKKAPFNYKQAIRNSRKRPKSGGKAKEGAKQGIEEEEQTKNQKTSQYIK